MSDQTPILPGATLGVLGGGQLGRMFAMAARRLGYRVNVLSPDGDTPTGQIADVEVRAGYEDLEAVAKFARSVSVVTFEFENVPAATAEAAARFAPVRPRGEILHITQNRIREKRWLKTMGLPTVPFCVVGDLVGLQNAIDEIGTPAVLKSAEWGYDGHGQRRIHQPSEAGGAWQALAVRSAVLEKFVEFDCELSVVAARGLDASCVFYGPFQNTHRNHILDVSVAPAAVTRRVRDDALEVTRVIISQLDYVGVLCVEFFLMHDGRLIVNELAPRPHNSGHLTIDAHVTCQFEQQVRAVCGLPLGDARQHAPAAMANLLGDLWNNGPPAWDRLLALGGVRLHLYGKSGPREGRKMGHVTALDQTAEAARTRALLARDKASTVSPRSEGRDAMI